MGKGVEDSPSVRRGQLSGGWEEQRGGDGVMEPKSQEMTNQRLSTGPRLVTCEAKPRLGQ